jgi:electron transfer flavoprotein alpha subunit
MTGRRRDPRAERAAQSSQGVRGRRIDRAQTAAPPMKPQPRPAMAMAPIRVDSPAYLVPAIADAPNGILTLHDRQILGAARLLAAPDGAVLLVTPTMVDNAGAAGADRALVLPPSGDPAVRAGYVADLLDAFPVRHAVFTENATGGDLARRVAALRDQDLFPGAERVTAREVTRPGRAGRSEFRAAPPRLITIAADCVPPYAAAPREARGMDLDFPAPAPPCFIAAEDLPQDTAGMALAEADFVAAAGNGVTDLAGFRDLAAALGATPGASRVLCDAGLMPRDRQVGASGTVLSGSCYLAFGIAGAPQHLQGVAGVEHVIAVNTDLHAAMIKRATLAIIADAQRVIPALHALLQRAPQP